MFRAFYKSKVGKKYSSIQREKCCYYRFLKKGPYKTIPTGKATRRRYIRLNDKNSTLSVTEIGNQYLSPFLRCRDQAGFACGTK